MPPSFSAIVPNYNDSARIGDSLASLAAQSVPLDEILIVDDGSTDNSVEVIERIIAGMPNARLIRCERNGGVVAALNRGFTEAKGDYLLMASANDRYSPKLLEWSCEMLAQHPGVGMVSGNVAAFDGASGKHKFDIDLPLPKQRLFLTGEDLVRFNRRVGIHFNGGSNLHRRDLVLEFGGLDARLKWHSDWFLNLLIAFRANVCFMPEILTYCRLEGAKSYSSGRFDWSQEREIIHHFILILREKYPREYQMFRDSALLPKYDLKGPALLMQPELRDYLTPLLMWRMIAHSLTYRLKYVVPRPVLQYFRRYFRV